MRNCACARSGFTLIELLVVITILSLLFVALLPNIPAMLGRANRLVDTVNMKWHHAHLMGHVDRHGGWPSRNGHKFIHSTWVEGACERTPENRDRFFSPQLDSDPYRDELVQKDVDTIWTSYDDVTPDDTHYAGRLRKHRRARLLSGREIIMATDRATTAAYGGRALALYGNGAVRELPAGHPDLEKVGK